MKSISIISVRGGCKNIKDLLEKLVIAYSIETALKSGIFNEEMVSTDDKKIAEAVERYGLVGYYYLKTIC